MNFAAVAPSSLEDQFYFLRHERIASGSPTKMSRSLPFSRRCAGFAAIALAVLTLTTAPLGHAATATLAIVTKTLAVGYVTSPYSQPLTASGGSGTGYTWSVSAGTLPNGIALAASTGLLKGTPTAVASAALTFAVKDSAGNKATATLTLKINPALAITTKSLSTGYVSSPYHATLAATGGSGGGISWSLASGSLPSGLALSTAGMISGKPTKTGTAVFSVAIKDSAGNKATAALTLVVDPQLAITTVGPLPVGYVTKPFTFTFTASGGSGTGYMWSTKSALPQNFVLSKTGVLSGTTSTADTVTVTVVVTDSATNTASASFTLIINNAVAQCSNDNQSTALVEFHGVYTFTLNRRDLSTGHVSYSIGSFNADGQGHVLNGVMDSNGPEFAAATQNTFTGTYTVGSDGRGRMDISIPPTATGQPTLNQSLCFALDSFATDKNKPPYGASAHAFVLEDDSSNVTSSGEFLLQLINPANSIMQGSWAFGLTGRAHYPTLLPNGPDPRFAMAGYMNLDGNGTIPSGELDEVISNSYAGKLLTPTYKAQTSLVGTYSIPTPTSGTPTGRGTASVSNDGVIFAQFVFYPYGGTTATPTGPMNVAAGLVVLETSVPTSTTTPVHAAWVGRGVRRPLTSFSTASLNGWSVASQYFIENPGLTNESEGLGIDVDHWDGAGNFTYTGDRNVAAVATTTSGKGTYTVDANGRFAVMVNGLCSPCGYLADFNDGFAIYDAEGTNFACLEKQVQPILGGPFQISSILGSYSFGSRWYNFDQQATTIGETVTRGTGNFTGTVDTNTKGQTAVDIPLTALETATATSGTEGRFIYQPSNSSFPYAIYVIGPFDAVAIPLGGSGSESDPLLRFIHQ
jgi:hypothetical protein